MIPGQKSKTYLLLEAQETRLSTPRAVINCFYTWRANCVASAGLGIKHKYFPDCDIIRTHQLLTWRQVRLVPKSLFDIPSTTIFIVASPQWYFDPSNTIKYLLQTGPFLVFIFITMSATGMHKKVQFGSSRKKDASLFV
jgi:hypothetical protein